MISHFFSCHIISFIAVAIGVGTLITAAFSYCNITMPNYIGAMLFAALLRNIWDAKGSALPMEEIDTLGGLSLNI